MIKRLIRVFRRLFIKDRKRWRGQLWPELRVYGEVMRKPGVWVLVKDWDDWREFGDSMDLIYCWDVGVNSRYRFCPIFPGRWPGRGESEGYVIATDAAKGCDDFDGWLREFMELGYF